MARLATLIVGRHPRADLVLDDGEVALRHLLIALEPMRAGGDPRLRVIDLRTGDPPRDEAQRAVESVAAEGAVLLGLGRWALLCLPVGDPTDWPEDAADAWACLPERVFVEERLAVGTDGGGGHEVRRLRGRAGAPGRTTLVSRCEAPIEARAALLIDGEPPLGVLRVTGRHGELALEVGGEAARRGVLLGRYARCHGNSRTAVTSRRVSRVHALVLELGGQLYAIDLGTTNGTYVVRGEELDPVRVARLDDRVELAIGNDATRARWRRASP